jgi:uncharacterized protein YqhQ
MKQYHYGGQAVMEGVMMRGRHSMAVAVREPSGRVVLLHETLDGWVYRSKVVRWPLVRGVIMLADTLRLGMRALIFSANVAAREETTTANETASGEALSGPTLWATLGLSLSFAVGLFFILPLVIVGLLDRFIESAVVSNLLEGLIRLALLIGYLLLIGRLPEIGRVFGYHGAEHKTINAHEAGAALTPASVRRFSLAHPRCGTGFLLVVVLLSIVVFGLLGRPEMVLRIASRILLVPVIAAIAYEYIKLTAHFYHYALVRWLAAPSMLLQRLTTREPDDSMLEVAIAALQRVLVSDRLLVPEQTTLDRITPVDEKGTVLASTTVSDG